MTDQPRRPAGSPEGGQYANRQGNTASGGMPPAMPMDAPDDGYGVSTAAPATLAFTDGSGFPLGGTRYYPADIKADGMEPDDSWGEWDVGSLEKRLWEDAHSSTDLDGLVKDITVTDPKTGKVAVLKEFSALDGRFGGGDGGRPFELALEANDRSIPEDRRTAARKRLEHLKADCRAKGEAEAKRKAAEGKARHARIHQPGYGSTAKLMEDPVAGAERLTDRAIGGNLTPGEYDALEDIAYDDDKAHTPAASVATRMIAFENVYGNLRRNGTASAYLAADSSANDIIDSDNGRDGHPGHTHGNPDAVRPYIDRMDDAFEGLRDRVYRLGDERNEDARNETPVDEATIDRIRRETLDGSRG